MDAGRWVHIAAVKEGATLRLYVDGTLRKSTSVPLTITSSALNVGLGANPNFGGNEYLDVALAGFRFYARALPPEEVRKLARNPGEG